MGYIRDENGDIILDELGNPLLDGMSTAVPTTTLTTGAPTTNVPTTLAPTTVAPTTLHTSTPVPTTTLTLPPPDTVIPTTLAPVATPVPATAPPVIPPISTPQNWKDNKGAGPWQFAAQPNKWGYLNNKRWSGIDKADVISVAEGNPIDSLTKHVPCGHWHKGGVSIEQTIRSLEPMWQQSIDVMKSDKVIGVGGMAEDSENEYVLADINYLSDVINSGDIFSVDKYAYGLPGTTLIRNVGGIRTIFYTNFVTRPDGYLDIWFYKTDANGNSISRQIFNGSNFDLWLEGDSLFVKDMAVFGRDIVIIYTAYDEITLLDYSIYASVSHDYGNTWNRVLVKDNEYGDDLSIDVDSAGNFYITNVRGYAPYKPFDMYKSVDSGDTWTVVGTVPVAPVGMSSYCYFISLDINASDRIYVSTYINISLVRRTYIYYSDDGGATWSSPSTVLEGAAHTSDGQISINGDVIVFAGKSVGKWYIIRSIDNGASWTTIGQIVPVLTWPNFIYRYPSYFNIVNDGEVFIYTHCGAYYDGTDYLAYLLSTDNGATWTTKQLPISRTSGIPTEITVTVNQQYDEPQVWPMD